ncbi:DUF4011 domain-containing protein, partial [Intestinibacter sp.]|uniref:DUF4011 domain-containing protein n=1 Tax=Intestinibacter sp. TaxID=1965304 RepID=UPI003F163FE7
MDRILNTYKERLINISSRNRSLVTRKLYKKRALDLYNIKKFNKNIDREIINFIVNRKSNNIQILEDPSKYSQRNINIIEEDINNDRELKLSDIEKKFLDEDIKKNKQELIKRNLELKKEKKIEEINKKTEELISISKGINYLFREINYVEKETGRYELYIGYNFVEGKFNDGTFVKAPLLLFPVRIIQNKGNWYLQNILDQDILLNKVFLLAISKHNSIEIEKIETEYNNIKDSFKDIECLLEYLQKYGIYIKRENKELSMKFVERKKNEDSIFKNGQLLLNSYIILGQFPVANSIYEDYQYLEQIYKGEKNYGLE